MANKRQISPQAVESIRAKIDTAMLVRRLQQFAEGDVITVSGRDEEGNVVFRTMVEDADGTRRKAMTKEQIQAAKLLLDKVLPSPQSIDVTSHETKTFVIRAPEPAKDMDDWLLRYGPKTIDGSVQ